jgi:putative IMPACT (imprinted ancient) family translation regulator
MLGLENWYIRFNDDGEPSGTAGRPILATIEGNDLTNIIVMVNGMAV